MEYRSDDEKESTCSLSHEDFIDMFSEPKGTFYGIPDIEIIWHGDWADPELSYKGSVVNYYTVEDSMWEDYKDGCTENGVEATEDDFKVWMPNHADTVYDLLEMLTRDD